MKSLHFGSAMIDIITLVASENIERATFSNDEKSFLMLETGRKLPALSITTHVGGGACNTAVAFARRGGWQPAVAAKLGDDHAAGTVRGHLAAHGIADRMAVSERATGTSVMIASHDRNASIFVHRGANETLAEADIPDMAGVDVVYIAPLSSASADCFPVIARRAREAGTMVAANPGIRQLSARGPGVLEALPSLDILSINAVEAAAMLPLLVQASGVPPAPATPPGDDLPPLWRKGLAFADLVIGLEAFCQRVRALGPGWVLVTDGTDGAYLGGPEGVVYHPSVPSEVAGTAGAGDAFCATLTAALAERVASEDALAEAAINAASVVSFVDTTEGLLGRDEITARRSALSAAPRVLA